MCIYFGMSPQRQSGVWWFPCSYTQTNPNTEQREVYNQEIMNSRLHGISLQRHRVPGVLLPNSIVSFLPSKVMCAAAAWLWNGWEMGFLAISEWQQAHGALSVPEQYTRGFTLCSETHFLTDASRDKCVE